MRQREVDVGHVGRRRLDRQCYTDAKMLAIAPRLLPPREKLRIARPLEGRLNAFAVIATFKARASDRVVGKFVAPDDIAQPQFGGVHSKFGRRQIHHTLEWIIELRSAEAAIEATRYLVCDHGLVVDRDVTDSVWPTQSRMHAI
jgi:hypothetical protein